MSYVVVHFVECREVFIDGQSQGNNVNEQGVPRSLLCGAGVHTFRLGGPGNFTPPHQTLNVPDATQINPFPVTFELHP
jgi:hypothetical protein